MNDTTTINVKFVKHLKGVSKKTEKPYNMLELSDGISPVIFTTELDLEDTAEFKRGDDVLVTVKPQYFTNRHEVIGIQ
jgi:hypothetical protein